MTVPFHKQLIDAVPGLMQRYKLTPHGFCVTFADKTVSKALYGRILRGKMQIDCTDAIMAKMDVYDAKANASRRSKRKLNDPATSTNCCASIPARSI